MKSFPFTYTQGATGPIRRVTVVQLNHRPLEPLSYLLTALHDDNEVCTTHAAINAPDSSRTQECGLSLKWNRPDQRIFLRLIEMEGSLSTPGVPDFKGIPLVLPPVVVGKDTVEENDFHREIEDARAKCKPASEFKCRALGVVTSSWTDSYRELLKLVREEPSLENVSPERCANSAGNAGDAISHTLGASGENALYWTRRASGVRLTVQAACLVRNATASTGWTWENKAKSAMVVASWALALVDRGVWDALPESFRRDVAAALGTAFWWFPVDSRILAMSVLPLGDTVSKSVWNALFPSASSVPLAPHSLVAAWPESHDLQEKLCKLHAHLGSLDQASPWWRIECAQ